MKYFLFDKAQKYVTRINTEYLIEAHYTEEINTAGQLEFTLPATMRLPQNVFYVCVTDPDNETSYLMFKIVTEKVTDEKVTYTCIENAYDELSSYNYIKDKRPTAIADYMLKQALEGTRWSVGQCPTTSQKFCSFYYISVLEAIQKIVNLWGLEVQFQVKIDDSTNEIKQRNVNLFNKLGKRTNKRFEYGSNLLSVTQANDSTGLYTALVGRGKGVQVSEGDTDTDPDGYGRRITFADVVWSTQSGNPLNKPAGQEYLEDPNATAAYGFPDGHPRIGFVVFQDCEDPNELIQLTYNKLQEVNHPQVQFSASIADVGSLNLGDTIAIIRHDIGIEYYTRVFKVVHDLLDSSNNTVELGDNIAGSNSITQQISNIQNNQSNVQNAIDTIVMNGSDGNKLFFGTDFPANGTDGDIFYRTLENGGTEMYIYKDGGWELVVSTEELDAVQKKVEEQTSQIQQAVDSANSAVSKADEAVAQVGTLDENVKNLDAESKQNQNDIAQAKSDLLQTKSDLDAAKANISAAQADIQADKQSIQNLSAEAQQQGQTIVNIQKTQSGLAADIADVKGNVSSLQDTANGLQATVADNKNNISSLKQTAQGLQSSITQGIGSYLPNGDFADSNVSKYWVPWDTTKDLREVFVGPSSGTKDMPPACLKIQTKSSENKTDICTKDYIPFNINEPIEIKAWSWLNASNGNTQFQFYIHCYDENHNEVDSGSGYFKYDNLKEWEQTDVSWGSDVWNKDTVSIRLEIVLFGGGIDTYGAITGLKIINGSSGIASQFTQTIDSLTSKIADTDGNISQLKQTSDSLTSQIGNVNNDISSLKQRADSMESNISDNKNDISDLRQTANSLQSNIQSKADISQITQLSNAFQTVVQNIGPFYPDGDFSDTDLSKYYDPWDTCTSLDNFSVVTDNSDWGYYLQICTPHGTINKAITKEYLPINAQNSLTFKGKSLLSYGGKLNGSFMVFMHFFDINKNEIQIQGSYYKYDNNNVWQDFSLSFTPPSNAAYVRVETTLDNSKGDGVYYGALDNLSLDNGGTIASKISQMSDDINMRVQKDDLLSQINIQAGSTLIQSNKLYLDASSVVFSGSAFIPSAAITDLSADKITTGTLNAANVHITNLDVSNLVGNTTSFVQSKWNSINRQITINGDEMNFYAENNEHITINNGNIQWYNSQGFKMMGFERSIEDWQPLGGGLSFNTYGGYALQLGDATLDVAGVKLKIYNDYCLWFVQYNDGSVAFQDGHGNGFWWSNNGFGIAHEHKLIRLNGASLPISINSDGTVQSWITI